MPRTFHSTYTPEYPMDLGVAGEHKVTFHYSVVNEYGESFKQKVFIYKAIVKIEYPEREAQTLDVLYQIITSPYTLNDWKREILEDFNKSKKDPDHEYDSARDRELMDKGEVAS